VLSSGRLILGPETAAFETEFAEYLGSACAVGMNSGTDALTLALMALDIGLGDEVLVPALTAPATAAAVRAVGAVPRFVDVSPDTLNIDPQQVERLITSRTRALIPVHLYGGPAPMRRLMTIAEKHELALIEDCAQAHGTLYEGRHAGTFGVIGCFSFYPTKNLGAMGDGGMCVTNDPEIFERLRRLRHYGLDDDRIAATDGRNSRLDELQAALLRVKLRRLDVAIRRRREIASRYRRMLADADVRLPSDVAGHSYHQFVVRAADRNALFDTFARKGVGSGVHYSMPLHLMPAYGPWGHREGDFPHAEAAARRVVSLPIFPELRDEEVDFVARSVPRRLQATA
jgi:dTDP-4-amino-4,6-dideoxygalactose transaminase